MRVPNVLVACTEKIASVTVGVLNILEELQQQEKIIVRFLRTRDVKEKDILWCDTFVDVRGSEAMDCYCIELCKIYERQTVYFLDDDLLNVPKEASCYSYYQSKRTRCAIFKMFQLCDYLWCVNHNISAKYSKYFRKTIIADACISRMIEGFETKEGQVKILYAGGIDHEQMIRKSISPVVLQICENYGKQVEFTFIGVNSGLRNLKQVKHVKYLSDYEEYRNIVETEKFDVAFAVIPDSQFYGCKYYNKYLEYSSIGTVGLYTKLPPYTLIVEDGYNGLLVDNDKWYEAFSYIIDHTKSRNEMRKTAHQMVKERFMPEAAGETLVRLLPEMFFYFAPKREKRMYLKKWKYTLETYLQKVNICIEEYGIKAFFYLPIKTICYIAKRLKTGCIEQHIKKGH